MKVLSLLQDSDAPLAREIVTSREAGGECGQVVGATKQGENDYLESCQDGNRYRVFTNAEGRVIVPKQ